MVLIDHYFLLGGGNMILSSSEQEYGEIKSVGFISTFQYYKERYYGFYCDIENDTEYEKNIFINENHDFIYELIQKQIKSNEEPQDYFSQKHHITELYTEPHFITIIFENKNTIEILLSYEMKYWDHLEKLIKDIPYKIDIKSRFGIDDSQLLSKPTWLEWKQKEENNDK